MEIQQTQDAKLSKVVIDKDGEFGQAELEYYLKKTSENERLDSVFRSKANLNFVFDNRARVNPHGMTKYDYKSITEDRREALEKFKSKVRRENYDYLNQHPEIDALIELFLLKFLQVQPKDPIRYCAEFFTLQNTSKERFDELLREEQRRITHYRQSQAISHSDRHSKCPRPSPGAMPGELPTKPKPIEKRPCRPRKAKK